jgi:hypothetical protein
MLERLIDGTADKIVNINTADALELTNRLLACLLVVPACLFLMLPLSIVENRLQTLQVHQKNIVDFKNRIDNLRRVAQPADELVREVSDLEQAIFREESEQTSITMQVIWGSGAARDEYVSGRNREWGNKFHQYSSDNNLMIASMASARLACLLAVILNGQGNAILAAGAGLAIGLFAMIAAKGAKAFLVAGSTNQLTELDPYSIVTIAFLAGAYRLHLLGFLESFVQRQLDRVGVQKGADKTTDATGALTGAPKTS